VVAVGMLGSEGGGAGGESVRWSAALVERPLGAAEHWRWWWADAG